MKESQTRELTTGVKQLISFTVGAEEYGLELLQVKEVIRMRQITWLPFTIRSRFLLGTHPVAGHACADCDEDQERGTAIEEGRGGV